MMSSERLYGTGTQKQLSSEQHETATNEVEKDEDALLQASLRWIPALPVEGNVSKAQLEVRLWTWNRGASLIVKESGCDT
jgi:hypothetical protein